MAFPWEPLGEEAEVAEGAAASGTWPPSCAKEQAELGKGVRSRRLKLGEELEPVQAHHLLISHGTAGTSQRPPLGLGGLTSSGEDTPCPACPLGGISVRHEIETLKFCKMFCQVQCCVVIETECFLKR